MPRDDLARTDRDVYTSLQLVYERNEMALALSKASTVSLVDKQARG